MLPINTVLYTKDGRKVGNALIVGVESSVTTPELVYHCITDYGALTKFWESDLERFFTIGQLCYDDHKHRNKFYTASGKNFDLPKEEDFPNFDPYGQ